MESRERNFLKRRPSRVQKKNELGVEDEARNGNGEWVIIEWEVGGGVDEKRATKEKNQKRKKFFERGLRGLRWVELRVRAGR